MSEERSVVGAAGPLITEGEVGPDAGIRGSSILTEQCRGYDESKLIHVRARSALSA